MRLGGEQVQKDSPFFSALSVSSFFSALGSDAIAQIASLCTPRKVLDGETLFLKGDPGDALYGVRRGQIVITTTTDTGRQFTLNILGPGDVFGEIALLDGHPRSADAVASGQTELFVIRRSDFQELLKRQPEITTRIIELLCERLRFSSERLEEASLLSLKSRLARRLLKLVEDFGEEIDITQEELSVLVGAGRETVNRQLQKWRKLGVVELGRARVRIVDTPRLQEEAAERDPDAN
ncbi:Crp/Fnr family transcriptional regulator [Microvirga zambiensis]|uniref:Crp/Fnr family transcriptional regulator n=1 Tax=Microvirga zambiensis TaxID=1402137 RepID=UPI00191FDEB2|nr:Crp/Fnr family transcriptional regulator [Microvirga zambiensis]